MSNLMGEAIERLIDAMAEEVEVIAHDPDDDYNAELLTKMIRYQLRQDPEMRAELRKDLRTFFERWREDIIYGEPSLEKVKWWDGLVDNKVDPE